MNPKWIGVIMVIAGCGSCGFTMAAAHRQKERYFENLSRCMDFMINSLQYRLTPLPELCSSTGLYVRGTVGKVFDLLAQELEKQISPNADCCMKIILKQLNLPMEVQSVLERIGGELGRFDLEGQSQGLEAVRNLCQYELERLHLGGDSRLRSYQTLGLCAGAALAILLI